MRCDDKVVLLVGGGRGIGRATAEVFAANGAAVAVADVDLANAEESAKLLTAAGTTASAHQVDITVKADVDDLIAQVIAEHGRIDILANTVGWTDTTFLIQEDEDYWRKVIDINLLGSIFLARAVMEHMAERKSGSIVLCSSDAGKVGTMGETVYAAAKAGVIGFVKSLAREVARDGIRVNAISPGPTDTPLLRAQSDKHVLERITRAIPLKRLGNAEEQANTIVFLGSDASGYITGQTISVSGGLTMSS
jgi:NAD(P)-dependent dehydrogenase (short-subunit alcohol dehydrogenase family)